MWSLGFEKDPKGLISPIYVCHIEQQQNLKKNIQVWGPSEELYWHYFRSFENLEDPLHIQ